MKKGKILSLALSLCIFGASTALLTVNAKAETNDKAVTITIVSPQIAGIVTITSTSGANVRSGPGTSYSIIGTANYGAELAYAGVTQKDTSGIAWYKVAYGSGYGWVSSSVSILG